MTSQLSADSNDIIFGATGVLLSHHQLIKTVIDRDVRVTDIGIGCFVFKQSFFNSFEYGTDILKKSVSIGLAPLAFLVETLANLIAAIWYLLLSVSHLGLGGLSDAKTNIVISGTFLLTASQALFATVISPILNFIDLLGSCATTLANGFFKPTQFDRCASHEDSASIKATLEGFGRAPTGYRL